MRRNIGGHADGDTGGAVEKQIGQARRQDRRFFGLIIIVGFEVNGVFVDISQQFIGNSSHLCFGIAHGGWRIVIL